MKETASSSSEQDLEREYEARRIADANKFKKTIAIVIMLVVPLWFVCAIPTIVQWTNPEKKLEVDNFALANSIFSAFGFAALIATIYLQTRELQYQREELIHTRRELVNSVEAQRQSAIAQSDAVVTQKSLAKLQAMTTMLQAAQNEIDSNPLQAEMNYDMLVNDPGGNMHDSAIYRSRKIARDLYELYYQLSDVKYSTSVEVDPSELRLTAWMSHFRALCDKWNRQFNNLQRLARQRHSPEQMRNGLVSAANELAYDLNFLHTRLGTFLDKDGEIAAKLVLLKFMCKRLSDKPTIPQLNALTTTLLPFMNEVVTRMQAIRGITPIDPNKVQK